MSFSRSSIFQPRYVAPVYKLLYTFTVSLVSRVEIMAVCRDELLISSFTFSSSPIILIYSLRGQYVSNLNIISSGGLFDATWTPYYNVVYTTMFNSKVVIVSQEGKVTVVHNTLPSPEHLSVSNDNFI